MTTFDLFALRFFLRAGRRIDFPPVASNVLRGGLGAAIRKVNTNAYAPVFAPSSTTGPSGLQDMPRPFVFRASHLNTAAISAGELFHFGLNWFGGTEWIESLRCAFSDRFGRVERVEGRELIRIPIEAKSEPAVKVRVRFVTPTELKGADRPEFGVFFARIRDRVSTLRALYGEGPLEIDFRAMGERARQVKMTRCELQSVDAERISKGTGQKHSLGGFTGFAEYEGDLAEFLPYLEIARFTGVGRQTVWGKGEIACEII